MKAAIVVLRFFAKAFDVAVQLKRKSDDETLKKRRNQAHVDPVGYFRQFVRVSKSDNDKGE